MAGSDRPAHHPMQVANNGTALGLGLQVIAEGIENPAELEIPRELECEFGQGYLCSMPMTAGASERFLAGWNPSVVTSLSPAGASIAAQR